MEILYDSFSDHLSSKIMVPYHPSPLLSVQHKGTRREFWLQTIPWNFQLLENLSKICLSVFLVILWEYYLYKSNLISFSSKIQIFGFPYVLILAKSILNKFLFLMS